MDLMELVRNGKGVAAAATAALTAVSFGWWTWRERAWKFEDRKFTPLNALLKDDLWQSVPEIELQRAIKRAHGKTISRREFALIYKHEDWPEMLHDRIRAGNFVDSLEVEGQFTDGRPPLLNRIPFGLLSASLALLGTFGASIMLLVAVAAWNVTGIGFGMAIAEALLGVYLAVYGTAKCESAKRLLSGKHYPLRLKDASSQRPARRGRKGTTSSATPSTEA